MKRLAAVVVLVLAVGGGFAGYQWYLNNTGPVEHFKLVYEQKVQDRAIRTVMLGRIGERAGWQRASERLASELIGSCAQCEILEQTRLDTLSRQQKALFQSKNLDFHYISMDAGSRNRSDIRIFYPAMGERYTGKACEFGARKIKASMNQGRVRCIKASG